jgi:hypothetical protein
MIVGGDTNNGAGQGLNIGVGKQKKVVQTFCPVLQGGEKE